MCLSIPGKVIEIEKDFITIDYITEKRKVSKSVVEITKGDYVIVSNKIIINKLSKEEAERFLQIVNAG